MITFNVEFEDTSPQIHVKIPLGDYLLDDKQVDSAKQTIQGIRNLWGRAYNTTLFINGEPARSDNILEGIVESYRTLYLLKMLDDVLERVKPLNDPVVMDVVEKVEPLIKRAKEHVEYQKHY